jgi:hypothetical protein
MTSVETRTLGVVHRQVGDVEARVAEAVQAHRPELAALVHETLRP